MYALDDGNLLLLSQEGRTLYGVDTNGNVLPQIQLTMNQPEGVTLNKADNAIYIVGESRQLGVLKLNSSAAFRSGGNHTLQKLDISTDAPAWRGMFFVSLLGRRIAPEKPDHAPLLHSHRLALRHGTVYLH